MANQEHLDILEKGVDVWNSWREEHPGIQPDLSEAGLYRAGLSGADLSKANLWGADLIHANLWGANLSGATLSQADFREADLREADLRDTDLRDAIFIIDFGDLGYGYLDDYSTYRPATLSGADLRGADLRGQDLSNIDLSHATLRGADLRGVDLRGQDLSNIDLSHATLRGANLVRANLVNTNLEHANLTGCSIYGISVWNVQLSNAAQSNLIITDEGEPIITVDNLEVAQFIHLLLNNKKIREVIDTITSKVVLILGRFSSERKAVLDALKEALRQHNYLPILFDFEKPASRDITETISTLAHLARFVIADITDAKSIPQELKTIVPNLPSVPVLPLILKTQHEYGMFEHFTRFPWVLPVYRYADEGSLLKSVQEKVITPAEQKAKELEKR